MRAGLVAILVLFVFAPALAADKPEPKYEGKPLDYWVTRIQTAENWEQRINAAEAIKAFGVNAAPAVPTLIAMLDDRSPKYRDFIADVLCALGPGAKSAVPELVKLLKEKKARDPRQVIRILGEIGPDAKEALPELVAALDEPELRSIAVIALCKTGQAANDVVPVLTRAVLAIAAKYENDPKSGYRLAHLLKNWPREPVLAFEDPLEELLRLGADVVPILVAMIDAPGDCGKEYAAILFCALGSKGEKGLPALKKLLKHENPEMRYIACVAMWKVAKSPDVVPVLAELLDAPPSSMRNDPFKYPDEAAKWLGDIGPAAQDSLPALLAVVQKHEKQTSLFLEVANLREAAREAIDKIEGKPKK